MTAIIPARNVGPLWSSFHGLPADGHPMRAAVVIEPERDFAEAFPEPAYRVTSGQALRVAG